MKVALVIIDMQRDFFDPESPCYCEASAGAVPGVKRLLEGARKRRWPVVHLISRHRPDGSDAENMERVRGHKHGVEGTSGAAILPGLEPQAGEDVVYKFRNSGFYHTELEDVLRHGGAEVLVLCGVATNGCVWATALDAYYRDFWLMVASDATGAGTSHFHDVALENMRYLIACTPSSSEVLRLGDLLVAGGSRPEDILVPSMYDQDGK